MTELSPTARSLVWGPALPLAMMRHYYYCRAVR